MAVIGKGMKQFLVVILCLFATPLVMAGSYSVEEDWNKELLLDSVVFAKVKCVDAAHKSDKILIEFKVGSYVSFPEYPHPGFTFQGHKIVRAEYTSEVVREYEKPTTYYCGAGSEFTEISRKELINELF